MDDIELTVIGCGDAFGSGGNNFTCFFIKTEGCSLLIDCGATSMPALKKHQVAIEDLDYVLISHLHGDHFGGLPFLILDSMQNPRHKPLEIIGPQGTEERSLQMFNLLYPGSLDKINKEMFVFSVYHDSAVYATAHFNLSVFPVIHTPASKPHGLRINFGQKIVSYSGDTSWCDQIKSIAQDADLFICECTFFDRDVDGHLNYRTLVEQQHEISARMLLTHFDREMLAAKDQVKFDCAFEGLTITI